MPALHEQIQVLLQAEKTPEALRLFAASGHADARLLQDRYDRLLKDSPPGRVKPEERQISISRIHFALLGLTRPETPEPEPAGDLRSQIQQLVATGKTEAALRMLLQMGQPGAETLLTRLTTAQQQYTAQEIGSGRWMAIRAEIAGEVLGIPAKDPPEKHRSIAPPVTPAAPTQKISRHDAAPLIRRATRQGDNAAAIRLLLQTEAPEGPALQAKFAAAELQHAHGLISPEEWGRLQAQICQAIFRLDWMQETELPLVLPTGVKAQILQLLHERKTAQALTLCADCSDQYLLFQAQLSVAKKQVDLGLIESDYWEMTESRINYALQAWIGQSPEPGIVVEPNVTAADAPSTTGGIWNKVRQIWLKKP